MWQDRAHTEREEALVPICGFTEVGRTTAPCGDSLVRCRPVCWHVQHRERSNVGYPRHRQYPPETVEVFDDYWHVFSFGVLSTTAAAHPDDNGRFTRIIPRERIARIYADQRRMASM